VVQNLALIVDAHQVHNANSSHITQADALSARDGSSPLYMGGESAAQTFSQTTTHIAHAQIPNPNNARAHSQHQSGRARPIKH
jgi:hypothetical protein